MSEQDTTPQDGTNPEPEVVEETEVTPEGTTDEPAPEVEETVSKDQFNQVLARAKKAEAQLKVQKTQQPKATINNSITQDQIDISILKSQGLSPELISELQALAKVRGKSLIDTQDDPIFLAIKGQKEAEAKAQKAKLGASKGSGSVKTQKNLNSPGLTKEEHQAMWREAMGK